MECVNFAPPDYKPITFCSYLYPVNMKTWVRLKGVDADEVQQEEESSDEAKHYSAWKSFRYEIDLYT